MTTCSRCGDQFDVHDARSAYYLEFAGDPDYDDSYEGQDVCGQCAIAETASEIDRGLAIDMVNGEAAYDDDHVQQWL